MSHETLTDDLWQSIALKLDIPDLIRFRMVSKSWMSLFPSLPPWLMLAQSEDGQETASEIDEPQPESESEAEEEEAEEEEEDEAEEEAEEEEEDIDESHPPLMILDDAIPASLPPRGFVSLGSQKIYQIDFPQLHQAQCVGSIGNWLITAHRDEDRTIRLLNPFSKQEFHLPSQLTFERVIHRPSYPKLRHLHLWKVVMSSSPSQGGDCIAMAIHSNQYILAIARIGDTKWISVARNFPCKVVDIIFYQQHFYAVSYRGELLVCDLGNDRRPPTSTKLTGIFAGISKDADIARGAVDYTTYLVEWLGELLMVVKYIDKHYLHKLFDTDVNYKTIKFKLYKFDFVTREWNGLKSLGNHSLFLGFNTSIGLCASNYNGLVKRNCIYFTDDFIHGYRGDRTPGGHDMGVFNLEDNTITPHFKGVSTCFYSPPVWIVPT